MHASHLQPRLKKRGTASRAVDWLVLGGKSVGPLICLARGLIGFIRSPLPRKWLQQLSTSPWARDSFIIALWRVGTLSCGSHCKPRNTCVVQTMCLPASIWSQGSAEKLDMMCRNQIALCLRYPRSRSEWSYSQHSDRGKYSMPIIRHTQGQHGTTGIGRGDYDIATAP